MKIKISTEKIKFLLLAYPFLRPLGLDTIRPFHIISNIWLFLSMGYITLKFVQYIFFSGYMGDTFLKCILIYFIYLILDTLILQHGVSEGLQKLFAAPCLCILYDFQIRKNPEIAIKVTIDIYVVLQILNIILWPVQFGRNSGYMFMGIRTSLPLQGFLGIVCAILALHFKLKSYKWKSILVIALCVFQVMAQKVSTGILAFALLALFGLVIKSKAINKVMKITSPYFLLIMGILLNVAVVFFQVQYMFEDLISGLLGETLALNGRTYIWERTLPVIMNAPLFGYGVYGARVPMPASWGSIEFNYVHTQSLQLLLDGGILLGAVFVFCFYIMAKSINKTNNCILKRWMSILMFCHLIIMIAEVCTNYLPCYATFIIISETYKIERYYSKK